MPGFDVDGEVGVVEVDWPVFLVDDVLADLFFELFAGVGVLAFVADSSDPDCEAFWFLSGYCLLDLFPYLALFESCFEAGCEVVDAGCC